MAVFTDFTGGVAALEARVPPPHCQTNPPQTPRYSRVRQCSLSSTNLPLGSCPSVHLLPGQGEKPGEGGAEGHHPGDEGGGESGEGGADVCFKRNGSYFEGGRGDFNEGGRTYAYRENSRKTKTGLCFPASAPSSATSGGTRVIFSQSDSQQMCYQIVTRAMITVWELQALCSDSLENYQNILY